MTMKAKAKPKPVKKTARGPTSTAKSVRLKMKAAKDSSRNGSKSSRKAESQRPEKPAKVESRRTSVPAGSSLAKPAAPERSRSRQFDSAVQAYEAGIKLLHGEEFQKAIKCFVALIAEYPEEPEIQERAKVLLHACEKKIQEKARTVLRSADDHYNVGVADLNRRDLESAVGHLQQALKLTPKADHILYALATANALQGNREQALHHLRQAIHYRPENRFLAARDSDFESLQEDSDFHQLVSPPEK